MIGAITWLLVAFNYNLHPFHVSVIDVEYSAGNKALQITQHIFLDDLEEALVEYSGKPLDIINPKSTIERDKLVREYVTASFAIRVNGKEKEFNYLGHELEADAMYCFIEVEGVKKIKQIGVHSNLLMSKFDDQVNLVHVNYDGKVRSMKLTRTQPLDELSYE